MFIRLFASKNMSDKVIVLGCNFYRGRVVSESPYLPTCSILADARCGPEKDHGV